MFVIHTSTEPCLLSYVPCNDAIATENQKKSIFPNYKYNWSNCNVIKIDLSLKQAAPPRLLNMNVPQDVMCTNCVSYQIPHLYA